MSGPVEGSRRKAAAPARITPPARKVPKRPQRITTAEENPTRREVMERLEAQQAGQPPAPAPSRPSKPPAPPASAEPAASEQPVDENLGGGTGVLP